MLVIETLNSGHRLGPTFLQLGPAFGPDRLFILEHFLHNLPTDLPWAVEVRHPDWFDQDQNENALKQLLERFNIDKVLFDSRPLFQSPPDDKVEEAAQKRKPKTPVRQTVTGKHPMLRFIGRNDPSLCDHYIQQWAEIVAGWIQKGLQPFIFAHAPDDRFAPEIARRFWQSQCREFAKRVDQRNEIATNQPLLVNESSSNFQIDQFAQFHEQDLPSLSNSPIQPTLFDEE